MNEGLVSLGVALLSFLGGGGGVVASVEERQETAIRQKAEDMAAARTREALRNECGSGQPRRGPAVVSRRRRRSSRLHAVSERDTHPPERRGHGGGAYQSGNGSGLGAGPLRIVDVLPVAGEGTAGHG